MGGRRGTPPNVGGVEEGRKGSLSMRMLKKGMVKKRGRVDPCVAQVTGA